ncbi:MAG TPA: hypothetical protein VHO03_05920 [Ignavibacteriales bacterium]|nr:hypothetical protein [Ignavibacteriales bacterium]
MTFSVTLDGHNIDDHLIQAAKIPFVEYTRAGEPIISSVKIVISSGCPYNISINSVVAFYQNGNLFYYGLVKGKEYDNETAAYNVTLESMLTLLREKIIDQTTMGDISAYLYGPNFRPTLLMKCYFEKCGLTLDTSLIDNLMLAQMSYIFYTTRGLTMMGTANISLNNLWQRPATLFAINQSYAASADFIDADNDAKSSKITFWDHFCRMCSNFGVVPIMVGVKSYKMVQSGSFAVADDDSYTKKIATDYAMYSMDSVAVRALWTGLQSNWLDAYYNGAKTNITDQVLVNDAGSGKTTLPWYNNDIWFAANGAIVNSLGDNLTTYFMIPDIRYSSLVQKYFEEAVKNFLVTKIEGPARFDQVAVRSNLIDIYNETSEIVQETSL